MRAVLACLVLIGMVSFAHAQAPGESAPPVPKEIILHKRDPNKATLLTGLGIAVPAALFAYGVTHESDDLSAISMGFMLSMFMPAAGHWYANRVGTYGFLARFGGFSFLMDGLIEIDDAKKCARGIDVIDGCDGVSLDEGRARVGVGISLYAGALIYDLVTSRREVREYNSHYKIQVMPTLSQSSSGIAVGGAF